DAAFARRVDADRAVRPLPGDDLLERLAAVDRRPVDAVERRVRRVPVAGGRYRSTRPASARGRAFAYWKAAAASPAERPCSLWSVPAISAARSSTSSASWSRPTLRR